VITSHPILADFRRQAEFCRNSGSALTAMMLDAAANILDPQTQTGRHILNWPGNPTFDALPLRLTGGLHALARRGDVPVLSTLYQSGDGDAETALRAALDSHDAWLSAWLQSPPQTNEVGRSAPLMAGLMEASARAVLPIDLMELGASAGLNQNLDRFAYNLGGRLAGDPASPVRLTPEWRGAMPVDIAPVIIRRTGVDQTRVDLTQSAEAERLIAYIWPDQKERLARIEAAISIARAYPPQIDLGDAGDWIEAQCATPQAEGQLRVVMHSVFWQYVERGTQDRIATAIERAGEGATLNRPLAWLRFEPFDETAIMALKLRLWPWGDDRHLANCHAHGSWVEWLG
jgi:hypothetical protein